MRAEETVKPTDSMAVQRLIEGVEPVRQTARDLEKARSAKAVRRQHQPMEAGGPFDEVTRARQGLFE
jgi:hypothetical protein